MNHPIRIAFREWVDMMRDVVRARRPAALRSHTLRWPTTLKLGIKRTPIDIEVMDPAYFPVICHGKATYKPHAFWKSAQDASGGVFGPFANTSGNIVLGIEPMSSVLDGVEERLVQGVMPRPVIFCSAPNSEYWGFRPPTADWLIEVTERMATRYIEHIDFWNHAADVESGPTMLILDVIKQRLQNGS